MLVEFRLVSLFLILWPHDNVRTTAISVSEDVRILDDFLNSIATTPDSDYVRKAFYSAKNIGETIAKIVQDNNVDAANAKQELAAFGKRLLALDEQYGKHSSAPEIDKAFEANKFEETVVVPIHNLIESVEALFSTLGQQSLVKFRAHCKTPRDDPMDILNELSRQTTTENIIENLGTTLNYNTSLSPAIDVVYVYTRVAGVDIELCASLSETKANEKEFDRSIEKVTETLQDIAKHVDATSQIAFDGVIKKAVDALSVKRLPNIDAMLSELAALLSSFTVYGEDLLYVIVDGDQYAIRMTTSRVRIFKFSGNRKENSMILFTRPTDYDGDCDAVTIDPSDVPKCEFLDKDREVAEIVLQKQAEVCKTSNLVALAGVSLATFYAPEDDLDTIGPNDGDDYFNVCNRNVTILY